MEIVALKKVLRTQSELLTKEHKLMPVEEQRNKLAQMNDVAMHYLRIEKFFRKLLTLDFETATELSSRPEFRFLETIQNVPCAGATTEVCFPFFFNQTPTKRACDPFSSTFFCLLSKTKLSFYSEVLFPFQQIEQSKKKRKIFCDSIHTL